MNKRGAKKSIFVFFLKLAAAFAVLSFAARKKKKGYVFENEPEEKNPMEGKKVAFVEDEKDPVNADGASGHLIYTGDSKNKHGIYRDYIKRGGDLVLSFGGLVILAPLFAVISIAVFLNNPGPVLFTQKRVGQNKQYFKMHKFRSMKMSTPKDVPTHMLDNPEQYITKVGAFLRKHSLDELPQLWDIFVGNMSFVGPRPALWNQDVLVAERDKYGANDVKPGLTGWAQINGRDELSLKDKALLDGEYTKKLGIVMDVRCLVASAKVFFKDESIVEGNSRERNYLEGKSSEELIGNIGFKKPVETDFVTKKKVLVTGAGSYIGESFKEYGKAHYDNLQIDTLDMLDEGWRHKSFAGYDILYHVAGIAHSDTEKADDDTKEKYYQVNTDLAVEVCKKAKEEGVKEFIFMSSLIVYGDSVPCNKVKMIDKNTVPKAANFYGDSKLLADVAVRSLAADDFKVIVLRPPMVYGKGSKGNYPVLSKISGLTPVFPDVKNERSMLFIDNLCEFLCRLMSVKKIDENSVVLFPQNKEWTNTSSMVKKIGSCQGRNITLLKCLSPLVILGSKIPGKIGNMAVKAFGNLTVDKELSIYEGLDYQDTGLLESIEKTEGCFDVEQNPLVTIITVSFNSEKTIRRTIESVLNQSYGNIEYRIIDGLSSDKTVEIAHEYDDLFAERKIAYSITSEKDKGIYDAMNKGINEAEGELIGIINSDDFYEENAVETAVCAYRNTGFDYFYGDINLLKEDGSIVVKHSRKDLLVTSRHWNHPSCFVKKDLYRQLGGFICEGVHDDFEFFLRVRRNNKKIVIVNKVIADFTMGGVSNEQSFGKALKRIKDRYRCYKNNGYGFLYIFECIVTEGAKYIVSKL